MEPHIKLNTHSRKLIIIVKLLLFPLASLSIPTLYFGGLQSSGEYSFDPWVNVQAQGAKGDGIADDTKAIRTAIAFAKSNHFQGVYFPDGTYLIQEPGDKPGIIKLLNGVSLIGTGANQCHIVLSGGRKNPSSIFYQAWWEEPEIKNIVIENIDFNGNIINQKFDTDYQFCHALSINNGKNIEIKKCKFQGFRGDGLLFGDTFEPLLNARIVTRVDVHDNEFFNIYREGTMFCCVNGATFYNNLVHGNGYLVGGVDIERHSPNESVLNVSVYNNVFDFKDGYGPIERGKVIKYRRGVTIGYFYEGYKNSIADSLSGHHKVYNNKIYQGQIDCFGHINVSITGNTIINSFENINGVKFISKPAINISEARATKGLVNVSVNNNFIQSAIPGNGIVFYGYTNVAAKHNTLKGKLGGVILMDTDGDIDANTNK